MVVALLILAILAAQPLKDATELDPPNSGVTGVTEFGRQWQELAEAEWGPHRSGENGWPMFVDLLQQVREVVQRPGDVPDAPDRFAAVVAVVGGEASPGDLDWDQCKEAIADLQRRGVFADLDRLIELDLVARPAQEGDMLSWLLPDLADTRTLVRILTARFWMQLHEGDIGAAMLTIEQALAVSRIAAHQPILIHQLVGIASAAMAMQAVRDSLADAGWNLVALQRLQETISGVHLPPVSLAIRGERLVALDTVRVLYPNDEADIDRIARLAEGRLGMIALVVGEEHRPRDWKATLRLTGVADRASIAAALDGYFQRAVEIAEVSGAASAHAARAHHEAMHGIGLRMLPMALVLPDLPRAIESRLQLEAISAGVVVSIALERYRRSHGKYPDQLQRLVPEFAIELPVDPYSGKTLGYQHRGDETYVLYAVGLDGEDNGGAAPDDQPFTAAGSRGAGFDVILTPEPRQGDSP
jgi:hypothetical protein